MSLQEEPHPQGPSAIDALEWMESRRRAGRPVLFRGQTRDYSTIFPSLFRPDVSEDDRRAWWAVLRRFVSSRNGLTGYPIRSPHDAVAVVQHYLVKSPVLDMTGTPEIALYFALTNACSTSPRIVYAADIETLQEFGVAVTDHAFLALPLDDGGRMHRWLSQDGFTVGTAEWTDLGSAAALDLARLPGVERFTFHLRPGEQNLVSHLGDLETTEWDPLAASVRSAFVTIARHLDCLDAVSRLLPKTGSIDAEGRLVAEIRSLLERAVDLNTPAEDVRQIESLLETARNGRWETSCDAALDGWTRRINGGGA